MVSDNSDENKLLSDCDRALLEQAGVEIPRSDWDYCIAFLELKLAGIKIDEMTDFLPNSTEATRKSDRVAREKIKEILQHLERALTSVGGEESPVSIRDRHFQWYLERNPRRK